MERPAAAGAAGDPDGDVAMPPSQPRHTIRDVLYPRGAPVGAGRQTGGRLTVADDEAVVDQAIAGNEETWTALRQHLNQISNDTNRVAQIKTEILFRMAKGEERSGTGQRLILDKYIETIQPDVNARGENGTTALMYAAANVREFHVTALLARGADPNLQNDMGETALMWAAAYGAMSPIRVFRERANTAAPVNFDLTDNLGWNALMIAAWCGNHMVVRQLANRTTEKQRRDAWGRNAANLARDSASPATARTTPQDNVVEKVIDNLAWGRHPRQGGRRTYRSKTKDKKRGTR